MARQTAFFLNRSTALRNIILSGTVCLSIGLDGHIYRHFLYYIEFPVRPVMSVELTRFDRTVDRSTRDTKVVVLGSHATRIFAGENVDVYDPLRNREKKQRIIRH